MHKTNGIDNVASTLLAQNDLQLVSCRVLQSLWAGYGYICQITATTTTTTTNNNINTQNDYAAETDVIALILKYISPPQRKPGQDVDEGYIRKMLSYQIEQFFYTHLAPQMPSDIAVAQCTASIEFNSDNNSTAMLLEDLRLKYKVAGEKRRALTEKQTYAALKWLAGFHGFWWTKVDKFDESTLCLPPLKHFEATDSTSLQQGGVWLNGGYTYLATRRSEYANLGLDTESEWSRLLCRPQGDHTRSVAELVADVLTPSNNHAKVKPASRHTTLIHGDVKSENLFTTTDGSQVAFFDFQYVGLGFGVCDLTKLFTCSVPMQLLDRHNVDGHETVMGSGEEKLLRFYHEELEQKSGKEYDWNDLVRHWETALVDWLRFQASWGFWGNTEWLESRVRNILEDNAWRDWLHRQAGNGLS